ncbi:hypothetical protein L1987_60033 [Smallanthus sonchifolius]|uniref:Uncharacterized protein n=1 Tax=Smallanthus sonchifolius TaxID=185202 RepID=A0ACB9D7I4_9ASTR|nr:hypothetical protein L1987_60033 [Smallanthus sonchifolius]
MSSSHDPIEISDSEDESVKYHPASKIEESHTLYETVPADPIPPTATIRDETPTYHTRPRGRVQISSSTPLEVALGKPPILYRKREGGPLKVKSARKKSGLPLKRTLPARASEETTSDEEPPRRRAVLHASFVPTGP